MGYSIKYISEINMTPPLEPKAIKFLNKFLDGGHKTGWGKPILLEQQLPIQGRPSFKTNLYISKDGGALMWNLDGKTDNFEKWIAYCIDYFFKKDNHFSQSSHPMAGYFKTARKCMGGFYAQGEEPDDIFLISIEDNQVFLQEGVHDKTDPKVMAEEDWESDEKLVEKYGDYDNYIDSQYDSEACKLNTIEEFNKHAHFGEKKLVECKPSDEVLAVMELDRINNQVALSTTTTQKIKL